MTVKYETGLEGNEVIEVELVGCPVLGRRVGAGKCADCNYFKSAEERERGAGLAPKFGIVCAAPRWLVIETAIL